MTPSDLLRTARLDRAAALLAAHAGTVSEVAYAVGFKSVAHFSNAFLAHTGARPSAYAETTSVDESLVRTGADCVRARGRDARVTHRHARMTHGAQRQQVEP